jgi:nucleotide-binding universal stress UspA family protein
MTTFTEPRPCIVVGFDDSPASHIALARAIERVGSTGKLYLVHAWQPPDAWLGPGPTQPWIDRGLTRAEAMLAKAEEAHPALNDITWESEVICGPPAVAIAEVASTRHADEIILGTRGYGRVRALLGSVSHQLIHLAPCPVTVIRERMVIAEADDRVALLAAYGPAP